MNSSCVSANPRRTEEYWVNVSNTAKDFVSKCLTGDPKKRPTAAEMLGHRWLADGTPHLVPDPDSPVGGPRDLLPHIQKRLGAKVRCEYLRHPIFVSVMLKLSFLAVRRAVWVIIAMKRMSTLASLSTSGELGAKIAKYKEESEKEDIDDVRSLLSLTTFLDTT